MEEDEQWKLVRMAREGMGSSVEAKALSGHFGRDKTCSLLAPKVFFPSIKTKVVAYNFFLTTVKPANV